MDMVDINPTRSIITLNIIALKALIKRPEIVRVDKKNKTPPYVVQMKPTLIIKQFYWSRVDLQCCVSFRCTAK